MTRALARLAALALFLAPALAQAGDDVVTRPMSGELQPPSPCGDPAWVVKPFPYFKPNACEFREWDAVDFYLPGGKKQTVEGRRLWVRYVLADEAHHSKSIPIQLAFAEALKKSGATVLKGDNPNDSNGVVATQKTAAGEFWMIWDTGNGNDDDRTTWSLTTVQVEPLAQEVETRAMPGALDTSGASCADPAWLVKPFPGFNRRSCIAREWDRDDEVYLPAGAKTLAGRHVIVTYSLADESKAPVSLAVQRNFLEALKKSGATIEKGEKPGYLGDVVASQKTPAGEFWMIWTPGSGNDEARTTFSLDTWQIGPLEQQVVAKVPPASAASAPIVASECKDPAWLVKQMRGFTLSHCNDRELDSVKIHTKDGDKTLAGRVHEEVYKVDDEKKAPVSLAVWINYVEALKKIGAELVSNPKDDELAVMTRKTPDGDVWYVWEHGNGNSKATETFSLLSLEPPVKVACKTEVYGVNFDFDKSDIRPDSEPVLQSVLALFQKDATLKAEIGGHTDDVGQPAHNQTLSEQRAAAVKAWLVAHGIAGDRLTTHGYGDSKPLVPNKDDASRAKNRRVELTRENCSR